MKQYTVTLPFPPSTNNLFVNHKRGGRVRSARYAAWRTKAHWTIKTTPGPRFNGPVTFQVTLGKPDNRRRDLSNFIKALEDALVDMHVIRDDSHITEIRAAWGDVTGARVTVREA